MNIKFPCRDPETGNEHVIVERQILGSLGAQDSRWVVYKGFSKNEIKELALPRIFVPGVVHSL
jgi:hypothetical protein